MAKLKSAIVLYLLGMVVIHAALFWKLRNEVRSGYSDFSIFYSAGKIVGRGLGSHLYDSALQYRTQQEFAPHVHIRQGALPYNHPPFEALIFVPLATIPYFAAYSLWDCANLLMLCALPLVLRPHVSLLRRVPAAYCLIATLAYFPIFIALLQGQDVVVLLLLFALAYAALKENADFAAGCWLGLGLFRLHLVLPLVLILCLRRKGKAIAGFASTAIGLALISIAVVGWKGAAAYPGYVLHLEASRGHGSIVPADMPNIRGLVESFGVEGSAQVLSESVIAIVSLILLLGATASCNFKTSAGESLFDLGFSLVAVVTILVSYHALAYDLSLLLLPIVLVASHVDATADISAWKRVALLAPICILFFSPWLMLLSFRGHLFNLIALVLLAWVWGISREMQRHSASPIVKV